MDESLMGLVKELEAIEKRLDDMQSTLDEAHFLQDRVYDIKKSLRERLSLGRVGGGGGRKHQGKGPQLEQLRIHLRNHKDTSCRLRDIADVLGQETTHVSARCSVLVSRGEVRKVSRGWYQWITPEAATKGEE
jgi:hypothetical protein